MIYLLCHFSVIFAINQKGCNVAFKAVSGKAKFGRYFQCFSQTLDAISGICCTPPQPTNLNMQSLNMLFLLSRGLFWILHLCLFEKLANDCQYCLQSSQGLRPQYSKVLGIFCTNRIFLKTSHVYKNRKMCNTVLNEWMFELHVEKFYYV